ncbi:hypothetical protein BB561_006230 [Smittium simulii]|uniref:CCHC-type domain-containing protein n=1 Tax=Smittium simulii TaxID=133385 RepID=A0A2T9Y5U4_9FUNG|nr:hypothetical protein BB561_006230 [Smittium simulii]
MINEQKAIDIFKLWTEDSAAEWQADMEEIYDTSKWALTKWLEKLKQKFDNKVNKLETIFELILLRKEENKEMEVFNSRFLKYMKTIPAKMYTEELIRKIYLDTLVSIDSDLWWQCTKLGDTANLSAIMNKTTLLMDIKEQMMRIGELGKNSLRNTNEMNKKFTDTKVKIPEQQHGINPIRTSNNSQVDEGDAGIKESIQELIKEIRNLTLLSQRGYPKKDYNEITCYTCNKKEHTSRVCSIQSQTNKNEPAEHSIMLALEETDAKPVVFGESTSKQPRLEHLLNSQTERQSYLSSNF